MTLLERFIAYLAALLEPLRFFKHAAERRALERAKEREYIIELVDTALARAQEQSKAHAEAMQHFARAMEAHSEAMKKWFSLFEQQQQDANLTTHTVTPEDEHVLAMDRDLQKLKEMGFPFDKLESDPEAVMRWLDESLPV